jgi:hypothetical protein
MLHLHVCLCVVIVDACLFEAFVAIVDTFARTISAFIIARLIMATIDFILGSVNRIFITWV